MKRLKREWGGGKHGPKTKRILLGITTFYIFSIFLNFYIRLVSSFYNHNPIYILFMRYKCHYSVITLTASYHLRILNLLKPLLSTISVTTCPS